MRFTYEIVGVTRSQIQKMNLQPIDPTSLASFATSSLYDLKEIISACDPAILGAMPEQSVFVYVLEILENITNPGSVPDVSKYRVVIPDSSNPVELAKRGAAVVYSQTLAFIVARIVEVQATLPDMAILESCENYCRNALGIGIALKLIDGNGEETKPCIPFPVWLPLPFLGEKLEWDEGNGTVGYHEFPPGMSAEDIANFLGKKAIPEDTHIPPTPAELARCTDTPGGQLRWYSIEHAGLTLKQMLGIDSSGIINSYPSAPHGQLSLALPAEAEAKLATLRRAGTWLYNECDRWSDDYFHVNLPKGPGYLVVWRDDLPSRPIQCLDPQKYLHDLLVEHARRLWGMSGASSDTEVRIPIPVGEVINLAVQRLQSAVNNELVKLIGTTGLNIRFAFLTSPYTDEENQTSSFDASRFELPEGADSMLLQSVGSSQETLLFRDVFEPLLGAQSIDLRVRPDVIPEGSEGSSSCAFAVQLLVHISGKVTLHDIDIDLNDLQPMAVGPRLIFIPEPVRLPTMAIFFWDHYFEGTPLVMLPSDSALFPPDFHFDVNSPGDVNEVRLKIVNKLNEIHNLLSVVQAIWHNESFRLLVSILGRIVSIGRIVIDATGKVENLSECVVEKHWYGDSTFNDKISSMVLVGPPHRFSHTVINCYQHSLNRPDHGLCLKLMLSGDHFVTAIPSFRRLREKFSFAGITVDLPYAEPPNDVPTTGEVDFNDQITGIEFAIER